MPKVSCRLGKFCRVEPSEQTVDLERRATFECAVLGHPVKEIAWYKNGYKLEMGHR